MEEGSWKMEEGREMREAESGMGSSRRCCCIYGRGGIGRHGWGGETCEGSNTEGADILNLHIHISLWLDWRDFSIRPALQL
jgi:hypothetical protein